jgi:hypothetical protein
MDDHARRANIAAYNYMRSLMAQVANEIEIAHDMGAYPETLSILESAKDVLEGIAYGLIDEEPNPAEAPPKIAVDARALQERADYNRDHAAELFGDKLYYGYVCGCLDGDDPIAHSGVEPKWREWATYDAVVFTPYGWVTEKHAYREQEKAQ